MSACATDECADRNQRKMAACQYYPQMSNECIPQRTIQQSFVTSNFVGGAKTGEGGARGDERTILRNGSLSDVNIINRSYDVDYVEENNCSVLVAPQDTLMIMTNTEG